LKEGPGDADERGDRSGVRHDGRRVQRDRLELALRRSERGDDALEAARQARGVDRARVGHGALCMHSTESVLGFCGGVDGRGDVRRIPRRGVATVDKSVKTERRDATGSWRSRTSSVGSTARATTASASLAIGPAREEVAQAKDTKSVMKRGKYILAGVQENNE
jgi:hypothetical protein